MSLEIKGRKNATPPAPRHLFFSSLFPPYSLFHNWCFDRLHVCQHRYPYFRFGYSKQTIFSENDPARNKLQCVTGNYPKTRFSRWVEIEGKASCNLYYSVAPLINRKKIYCQIGFSLPMTDIYIF